MKSEVAKHLIEDGVDHTHVKQVWADLGAGTGLFTTALSVLLNDDSIIYAIDTNANDLSIINVRPTVTLKKIQCDFVDDDWNTESLNGILIANALHFVKEKQEFLKRVNEKLTTNGRIVIVEYEMDQANSWVPYPVGFKKMSELLSMAGFSTIQRLKEVPSVYDNRMIYSVMAQ